MNFSVPTLTAHVTDELIKEIDSESRRLDRSRAWVVKQAVREFLERRNDEEKRWNETLEAIAAAERGEVVSAEEVLDWVETWGVPGEKHRDDT